VNPLYYIAIGLAVMTGILFWWSSKKPGTGSGASTTPSATAHPSSILKTAWGKVEGFWHWMLGIWLPILIVGLGYVIAFHKKATDESVEWVQTGRNWALPVAVVVAIYLLFRGKGGHHHGGSAHGGGHGHHGLGGGAKAIIWLLVLIALALGYLSVWHLKVDHRAPTRAEREEHVRRVLNPPTLRVTNTVPMIGPLTANAWSETVPLQALGASGYRISRSPDSIPILVNTGLGIKLVPAGGAVTNFPALRLAFMLAEASDATNDPLFMMVEWWK
jgi:hypothetical protein